MYDYNGPLNSAALGILNGVGQKKVCDYNGPPLNAYRTTIMAPKVALARLYQISGLALSDLPWNSCTVAHIYQTQIYHGSDLPTSH